MVRKQPAKALRCVQNQIAKVPNNSQLYSLLGKLELKKQQNDKAEEVFRKQSISIRIMCPPSSCARTPKSPKAPWTKQSPDTNVPSKPILATFVFIFPW